MIVLLGVHFMTINVFDLQADISLLILSYALNYLMALLIVLLILKYISKLKTYIGFLFMLGSFLKFAVFFIWFYPIFKEDGVIDKIEFSLFFIPYVVSLIFETKKLSAVLNDM